MGVALVETDAVRRLVHQLREFGCIVHEDEKAGLATARDGDVVVYMALQKGRGGPWIVRYKDSNNIKWYMKYGYEEEQELPTSPPSQAESQGHQAPSASEPFQEDTGG